ncbi:MAG: long-chain fatty acid--CoA ligase [Chloroflexi bacterium]|nr:long-chain fatty acid--CoA ligase [Chloroflexota bacterium]
MHAADLLTSRARLSPNKEALYEIATEKRYTYAELNARANRAANFLRGKCGVQKGDRVSIYAHNGVCYIDLLYGLAKIGAIFAPLNWRLTANELTYIVNDCEPRVIIGGPDFMPTFDEMRPNIRVEHIVTIDEYTTELARASSAEPARPSLSDDDPLCILYTSGTTGRPKGAVIPHRQVLWNCINTMVSWGLRDTDISPIFTPMFHSGGLFAFLTPILYVGGKIILARTFEPAQALQTIVAEKCTVILGVPTLYQMWLALPNFSQFDLSHVRYFINGGATMPQPLWQAWTQATQRVLRRGYGLTEVGVNCFSMTDEESLHRIESVGKPIFHSAMRLVDPQTGKDVAVGETGELWIYGPHVCAGYWRNTQATAESITDGWFHTGDGARQDEDGFFYIVGRFKDMIKSGGENIYAAEVEAIFRDHPAVQDAALIGQPDEKWGEVGLMIVVCKPGQAATENNLLKFCDGKLARYKIPKRIIFADSLPYSPYGKVEKVKLKAKYVG